MPAAGSRAYQLRWGILGTLLIGTVTGTLGNSLVNVALPTIMDHFSVDVGTGIWAVTSYVLFFAVTMPLFGRLGDMYGYKRTYLIGLAVFGLSSCVAAFAPTFPALIFMRAVQGFSNGPILPAIMAIIGTVFPPGERGRAMGVWALANSATHAAGPPLSGFLTQYLGWQWIFLSYVPLCALGVFLVMRLVPDDSKSERQPFDVVGALTLTTATLLLMYNLRQVAYQGWISPASLVLWALFAWLLVVFLVAETRNSRPFVDLSFFTNRPFSAATTIAFIQAFCQFGLLFLIPLFLIQVGGYKAAQTGLILACLPVSMAVAAPMAGRLADRYGCRTLCVLGMLTLAVSGLLLSPLDSSSASWYLLLSLAAAGIGMGMVQSPAPAAVSLVMPSDQLGVALGLFNMLRFVGATLGPTVFALMLQTLGPEPSLTGYRADFYIIVLVAVLAAVVGLRVPTAHSEQTCEIGD
ncbi:MAG: MFS transporter [Anaerolineae bacterium]|nr:MFS transporter [Anaerolineae bacterium]